MADNDDRNVPQEGMCITKETLEGMMKQMEGRIFTALSEHLRVTSTDAAISSKPMDRGKGICIENNHDEFCDSETQFKNRGMLPHPGNKSLVQTPVTSQQHVSPFRPSILIFPEQPPGPVFTEELIRKMIQEEFQVSQMGLKGCFGLDLDSFSIAPGITLPENFKAPEFALYAGNSNAQEHLRVYCKKMAPHVANDDLMIRTFQYSLTGPALKWFNDLDKSCMQSWKNLAEAFARHYDFNERLAVTKEELGKMERKHHESIMEYAKRWRLAADQVRPALTDGELAEEFFNTLELEYREKLAPCIDYDISQMVRVIERMGKGHQADRATKVPRDRRNNLKKKENSVNVSSAPASSAQRPSFAPRAPFATLVHHPMPTYQNYQSPSPYQQNYHPPQAPPMYQPQAFSHPRVDFRQVRPRNAYNPGMQLARPRAPMVTFDPLPISYGELYNQLFARGRITPAAENLNHTPASRSYNPRANCIFHSGQQGLDIENCFHFKTRVQEMIKAGQLNFTSKPNVNANLLSSRDAPIVGTRGLQSPQCIGAAFGQGYEVKKGDGTVDDWSAPTNLRPPAQNSSCYPAPLALSQSNLRQPTLQHVEPVRTNTHYHHDPSSFALQRNPTSGLNQSSVSMAQHRRDRRFRHFDTFPISYAELFRQLAAQEVISPVIPKPVSNPLPRSYNPNLRCLYHSNLPGHDTQNCTALKNMIQDLYEEGKLKFDEAPVQPREPNIPRIPLPNHPARH